MLPMATLRFHIVPNAKIDGVLGEHGAAIKIKLRAPALDGKANTALRSVQRIENRRTPNRAGTWPQITRQNHSHRRIKR
jgi:hypothetical protein